MLIPPTQSSPVWLLVRSKPKQEGVVAAALAGRGIESYVPRVLEPRLHVRAPQGPVPLFPSYVFARCAPRERFAAAHYCPGGLGIVRFGELLAAVEDAQVEVLRSREGERGYLVFGDVRRRLEPGARARLVGGPLKGFEGIVERYLPARDRVRMLLTLIGGVRRVEVDARHLRCA
ncbi:MAG TPA: transcription termination/antitermination NusG family protein [Thermoanaerobaculaceae bacterium]|nr:transcription termination/antitermination NusG family protein [Thermoanaerobaculaceae bacterium]